MSTRVQRLLNWSLSLVTALMLAGVVFYYVDAVPAAEAGESVHAAKGMEGATVVPEVGGSFPAEGQYCLTCHQGILPPRPFGSEMMKEILAKGAQLGDPNGCVVCHGGTPSETKNKTRAHSGVPKGSALAAYTPVPGAMQVNANTCGLCHKDHTYNAERSIMNTDAGKMKTIMWSFGLGTENHDHIYGDHDVDDPDGPTPRFGTARYKAYMQRMADSFPGQYPAKLMQIPEVDLSMLDSMPEQAAYTYLRNCNACHLSNKGYLGSRGHARGMGCAACHSLFAIEGRYEGADTCINRKEMGHVMVHAFQGSRKSPVAVNGKVISGVQVSTCAACHAAGRRIGHTYQGLAAFAHGEHRGPFDPHGGSQKTSGGYVYHYVRDDVHHRIDKDGKTVMGLLCQDCHTTSSMHGNGNIGATTLATIEIECSDCHGTPDKYPWELPLGFGDEYGLPHGDEPRGVTDSLLEVQRRFAMVYPKEDGYILNTRGNPLGNVVRSGDEVKVHSASGHDFTVPVLKNIAKRGAWAHPEKAITAMMGVKKHMETLECYACHSTWVPQYYGYKYVIDYTKNSVDWLASPEKFGKDGLTADAKGKHVMQPGAPTNWDYAYDRWENPPLGINGEGRVSPLVGVIQTVATVLDPKGKPIVSNKVWKAKEGYSAMEMQPVQPHTASREARACEDCHGAPEAVGYGIDGGASDTDPSIERYTAVFDKDGELVSKFTEPQIHAIADLHHDFMQIIDSAGVQLQTVDSHWPTSMPLTNEQRDKLSRRGTCLACHKDIPSGSIPMKMLGKIAHLTHLGYTSPQAHAKLLSQNNNLVAWVKALGIILLALMLPLAVLLLVYRERVRHWFSRH